MKILFFLPTVILRGEAGYITHIKELVGNLSKLADIDVITTSDLMASVRFPFMTTLIRAIPASVKAAFLIQKRRPDIIYTRGSQSIFALTLAKLFRLPIIIESNALFIEEWRLTTSGLGIRKWSGYILGRLNDKSHKYADHLVVVTPKIKKVLETEYKISPGKITAIENGANTELFSPMNTREARTKLNLNQTDNYICFVGSLIQWQGVEYLIKASPYILEEYPHTCFLIIGDGPIRQSLTKLVEQLGVSDKFIFIGMVPYEKVPLYINSSDICVVPKKPIKCSPLKLYEYMACGKPVIASDIEGVREILVESKSGICVLPESPHELAKATISLLRDPSARESMGENGRRHIVENRSWESVARKVFEVCQTVVQNTERKAATGNSLKYKDSWTDQEFL